FFHAGQAQRDLARVFERHGLQLLSGHRRQSEKQRISADVRWRFEQVRGCRDGFLNMSRSQMCIERGFILPLFHESEVSRVRIVLKQLVAKAAGFAASGLDQLAQYRSYFRTL